MTIGVLALQGGISEHEAMLSRLELPNLQVTAVRSAGELSGLDGIILPGGESTAQGLLLKRFGMVEPLRQLIGEGLPVWGTCAGMILLAKEVENQTAPVLACMDICVRRNWYGSQQESFVTEIATEGIPGGFAEEIFIRAPGIVSAAKDVEILASVQGHPVACRQRNMIVTAFHPELTEDTRFHQFFIDHVLSCQVSTFVC
ncbi:MAG: pyridoxal 5'-phosphate synthase glutaminase subunit PdxT [Bacteroidetes bacterium]|nr:pyridoxal 5'-phosphate synthase glutaminase subunit PdxT [Bacteroidota bacterium]